VAAPLRRRGGVSKLRHQGSWGCRSRASPARRSLSAACNASTWRPEPSTTWRSCAEVAPELVNVARVDAVRGCRVAELVRVNDDAKQNRDEELKTRCLFAGCLFVCMLKKLPGIF
jgi:hypothetical protein